MGISISTLGASFIESRLKPKINIEEESKKAINEKISKVELLNKEEYSWYYLLIHSIMIKLKDKMRKKIMIIPIVQNAVILILKTLGFATDADTHY